MQIRICGTIRLPYIIVFCVSDDFIHYKTSLIYPGRVDNLDIKSASICFAIKDLSKNLNIPHNQTGLFLFVIFSEKNL